MKPLFILALLTGLSLSTGCATLVKGNDQSVSFTTVDCEKEPQENVRCHITNKDNDLHVETPGTVTVEKGSDDLAVSCEVIDGTAKGDTVVVSTYESMNAGNILLGGGIGLIVDAASGAMWKYPGTVEVSMSCMGDDPNGPLDPNAPVDPDTPVDPNETIEAQKESVEDGAVEGEVPEVALTPEPDGASPVKPVVKDPQTEADVAPEVELLETDELDVIPDA